MYFSQRDCTNLTSFTSLSASLCMLWNKILCAGFSFHTGKITKLQHSCHICFCFEARGCQRHLPVYLQTRPPRALFSERGRSKFKGAFASCLWAATFKEKKTCSFPTALKMSFVLRLTRLRHRVSDNTGPKKNTHKKKACNYTSPKWDSLISAAA